MMSVEDINIRRCYCTGNVIGDDNPEPYLAADYAGFIGYVGPNTTIKDAYARGNVTSCEYLAGFVAYVSGVLQNCYSTGRVVSLTGTEYIAGFVQQVDGGGEVSACFWDTQTSGLTTSAGGTGKTTAQMKYIHTFSNAGWDFRRIWGIKPSKNNGYPFFGRGRHSPIPSAPNIPLEPFRRADVY
jgi:hypothetical protein